ncbi:MAG: DnaJ domain-containing protein [candidate division NC10 bacterium]|nr:DnaJ domain-containing protein [candidate division NC10 bacterium]
MARPVGAEKDYYAILGVGETAKAEEIKRTYRRLALQYHPDRNPGDEKAEERFKEVTEAYGVLIDEEKRRQYDRLRKEREWRPSDQGYTPEEIFRDLFTSREAASIFAELQREFKRSGLRFDEAFVDHLFFGGRGFVFGVAFFSFPFRLSRSFSPKAGPRIDVGSEGRPSLGERLKGLFSEARALAKTLLNPEGARSLAGGKHLDFYDELPLTRWEAESGTRKRIVIRREGKVEEVVVRVPAGVKSGTKLRLKGKGLNDGRGRAGNLYLAVKIES